MTQDPATGPMDWRAVDALLLDMDGTLYVDEGVLPGARELVALLRRHRKPHVFLTNNSSAAAADYLAKLRRLGFAADEGQVLTSGVATADYLRASTPYRRLFLLGTPALEQEFRAAGFTLTADDPQAVVLGFDKTLTFDKLARACLLLARGLPYVATHPDLTCITAAGLIPDTGAFIAAIEAVVGRRPTVIGKPMPRMVQAALARLGGPPPGRTAIVGDQLDTDQTMARDAGLLGVLVLSGETSLARLQGQTAVRPALVLPDVSALVPLLRQAWGG